MRKLLLVLVFFLLLASPGLAYVDDGNAFYCGDDTMTAAQICTDCTNALNDNGRNIVYLNASVSNYGDTCINDPNNFDNKVFDCRANYTIDGADASNTYGIYAYNEDNIVIKNCIINDFKYNVYLRSTDNVTIDNNTINSSTTSAVYVFNGATNITVSNSTMYDNYIGMGIASSSNITIENNTIIDTSSAAIQASSSSTDLNISYNNITRADFGIYLISAINNTINNNTVYYTYRTGIYLYTWLGTVANNTVANNTVTYCPSAIYLRTSDSNKIINNTFESNWVGFQAGNSQSVYMRDNQINNNVYNFYFYSSTAADYTSADIDHTNTVDGYQILYNISASNYYVNNTQIGAMVCVNCDNVVLHNITLNNSESGIVFYNTDNSEIENSTFYGNRRAIWLQAGSTGNTFNNNTINNGERAIYIQDTGSLSNTITNNFIKYNSGGYGYIEIASALNTITNNTIHRSKRELLDTTTNTYVNNTFTDTIDSTFMVLNNTNQTAESNTPVNFNISVYDLNLDANTDFVINKVSIRPSTEAISYTKNSNNITGSFTPSRQGIYSIIANISTDSANNNIVIRKWKFFVNTTERNDALYMTNKVGNNKLESGGDKAIFQFYQPAEDYFFRCGEWVSSQIDEILPYPYGVVYELNISSWYSVSSAWISIQRYARGSTEADIAQSLPTTSGAIVFNTTNFTPNWTIDYQLDWKYLTSKLASTAVIWSSNSTDPSYINITYNHTTTPKIKAVTDDYVEVLSATSSLTNINNSEIILQGTGIANVSIEVPHPGTYHVYRDHQDCDEHGWLCNFTQNGQEINVSIVLGSEHQIDIRMEYCGGAYDGTGDWIVTANENITCEHETIATDGDVIVYGNLTLIDVNLVMFPSVDGEFEIVVHDGASMNLTNQTNVTSDDTDFAYKFRADPGSIFEMRDSYLTDCGYTTVNTSTKGLFIATNTTKIINNTISDSEFQGVIFNNSHHGTIENNTFTGSARAAIQLEYSNYTIVNNNTLTAGDGTSGDCIAMDYSGNNLVSNNTLLSCTNEGISSSFGTHENNSISRNTITYVDWGILSQNGDYNHIYNNNISNVNIGIRTAGSSDHNLIYNNIIHTVNDSCIEINSVENNSFYNNTYTDCNRDLGAASAALGIIDADNNKFTDEKMVNSSVYGIYIYQNAYNNTFTNVNITNSTTWDLHTIAESNITAVNMTFNNTNISFTSMNISINQVTLPPTDIAGLRNFSSYINVSNATTGEAWINLTMYYDDSLTTVESSIYLSRYNGSTWFPLGNITDPKRNTDENYVYSNISSFSIFAPIGNEPPVRSDGSPSTTIDTASTSLSLTTDESATCKYSTTAGTDYASMTSDGTSWGTSHAWSLSGLTDGNYVYYIRCNDTLGVYNTDDYIISFTVDVPQVQPGPGLIIQPVESLDIDLPKEIPVEDIEIGMEISPAAGGTKIILPQGGFINITENVTIDAINEINAADYKLLLCNQTEIAAYEIKIKGEGAYLCFDYTDVTQVKAVSIYKFINDWIEVDKVDVYDDMICGKITSTPYMIAGFKSTPDSEAALAALESAERKIETARQKGIDVSQAEEILLDAYDEYYKCDYELSLRYANNAKVLASVIILPKPPWWGWLLLALIVSGTGFWYFRLKHKIKIPVKIPKRRFRYKYKPKQTYLQRRKKVLENIKKTTENIKKKK